MDIVASLGPIITTYFVASTILETDVASIMKSHYSDVFFDIVKTQVKKHNDYRMTVEDAYELVERQGYQCRKCNAHLTLDRVPIICRTERIVKPFGLCTTKRVCYQWCCEACCNSGKVSSSFENEKTTIRHMREFDDDAWTESIQTRLSMEDGASSSRY